MYYLYFDAESTFELTETTNKLDFDIARSIHEFPKTKSKLVKENVFYIIQNLKKKEWQARAKLTDQYIKFLNHYIKINKTQKIYVTEENNPNGLPVVIRNKYLTSGGYSGNVYNINDSGTDSTVVVYSILYFII